MFPSMFRRILQIALPVVVLALGVAAATALARSREEVPAVVPPKAIPTVRTVEVSSTDWQARVRTTGTVRPATESDLLAEVAGRVLEVSPALAEGSFVAAGQTLVRLDDSDYRMAVAEARAAVAQAELALELQRAEAESARSEWQAMQRNEEPSPLVLREPQVAEAEARLTAARARLDGAARDVARCLIQAPYDGRVLVKNVDLGQYVSRNALLARVYAIDAAEVRLPVADSELAFLDLDVSRNADGSFRDAGGSAVELSAAFGGRLHVWQGRVVRTEGQLDPKTRMVNLIARVETPYAADAPGQAPLLVNLFVDAQILGPTFDRVHVLPRTALRGATEVLVVDADERLRIRTVELLRKERDTIVVRRGLEDGERVCVTPLEAVVDGMQVRVAEPEARR
jgi:RND family efflux transporter MFP subunit